TGEGLALTALSLDELAVTGTIVSVEYTTGGGQTGGGQADDRTAMAVGTRAGAPAHHGRKPAAVSQPVRIPQPEPAAHEAHCVERDVRHPVARGFPCAAALYGAHRLPGAHRAAARCTVSRRTPAAAQGALGRGAAVGAHLVGAVHPGLGDRDAGVACS